MNGTIAIIGFGEAGQALGARRNARAFDIKTAGPDRAAKLADYARLGVTGCETLGEAVTGAELILSLVTADQALIVAEQVAAHIAQGALLCDCNSVAPDTKRAAAASIEAAGGRYVDVAVMAPVLPARLAVPLLLSGAYAAEAQELLIALGFTRTRIAGDAVGQASSIKMIRSVMIKGVEALTAECMLAANAAGVLRQVIASLDTDSPRAGWTDKADYNLDRMIVHGLRRAAEMEEAVKTLDALGTGSTMTRGTVDRQRALGALRLAPPPTGLADKLRAISEKSA